MFTLQDRTICKDGTAILTLARAEHKPGPENGYTIGGFGIKPHETDEYARLIVRLLNGEFREAAQEKE